MNTNVAVSPEATRAWFCYCEPQCPGDQQPGSDKKLLPRVHEVYTGSVRAELYWLNAWTDFTTPFSKYR